MQKNTDTAIQLSMLHRATVYEPTWLHAPIRLGQIQSRPYKGLQKRNDQILDSDFSGDSLWERVRAGCHPIILLVNWSLVVSETILTCHPQCT